MGKLCLRIEGDVHECTAFNTVVPYSRLLLEANLSTSAFQDRQPCDNCPESRNVREAGRVRGLKLLNILACQSQVVALKSVMFVTQPARSLGKFQSRHSGWWLEMQGGWVSKPLTLKPKSSECARPASRLTLQSSISQHNELLQDCKKVPDHASRHGTSHCAACRLAQARKGRPPLQHAELRFRASAPSQVGNLNKSRPSLHDLTVAVPAVCTVDARTWAFFLSLAEMHTGATQTSVKTLLSS